MLISFFLQTITQVNENHYQTSKNMFKICNKITRKKCRSNLSKVFLHLIQDGHFWVCKKALFKICLACSTMMKLGTVTPYLKKIYE